ncbi:cystathionine gamma-synthase [Gallaecimonas mangrovi]|uniref:cystathionine gamma-synthase n=1 Tax=Gallaecimonas mangrovi TaxID=2291597 RepID=UPI000E205A09|nr:cystathionine gamma-synthase [Gallaecimonas mangrovi]
MTKRKSTTAVRSGLESDKQHNSVVPPLYLSTNYTFDDFRTPGGYDYSRSNNPSRDLLAKAICDLEGGARAVVTATGMAAVTTALQLLSAGDTLVVPHDCYGGSWRLFNAWAKKGAFNLITIDQADPKALAEALAKKPKLVWVETPSNPLLRVVDVTAICQASHDVGALVLVDNTFLSPIGQSPLELGADLVLHSTTKYINGHSDVVGGALIAKDKALGDELAWWANCIGVTGSAFDSYLTLRGIRTLAARFRIHEENAQKLTAWLADKPEVAVIHYPGLKSHPGHELAKRQQKSFGAMFSVELNVSLDTLGRFVSKLKLFSLAESLGGVESLVAVPATMTHAAMTAKARKEAGLNDGLLRFSVGIEDADDLIEDLAQAWPALKEG